MATSAHVGGLAGPMNRQVRTHPVRRVGGVGAGRLEGHLRNAILPHGGCVRLPCWATRNFLLNGVLEMKPGTVLLCAVIPISLSGASCLRPLPENDLDVVINGECFGGVASTVLDLTHDAPRVVRVGAISKETLEAAIGHLAMA